MTGTQAIDSGIWLVDTRMADVPEFTAVYVLRGDAGAALVDAGVSVSCGIVLEGLEEAGIARDEVRYIIVTHIHLDHAGGAGHLVRELPNASVVVARRGIDILADPVRLVASARRSLGGIADMYGDMEPIARERLAAAEELGSVSLGDKTLRMIPAPGHASTHICVVDETSGTLFCGDSLGIYLAAEGKVIPVTPPPDFDLEEQRRTLVRLAALDCGRTCFTHFGCGGASAGLARLSSHNLELMVEVVGGMDSGSDPRRTAGELMRIMDVSSPYGMFMFGGMSLLNVHGISRYLERNG
jgi:glyoxylase-like metal-dependent hydrolase (beta-lactamase superfamily II)